ncbi:MULTISPECIES: thiamine phosphate synthase [unclassified Campylobacter]|uniref:thiamine phosphate synthase n=1 Tax=unclassified Campylobacter TaxID=2593542 RepID=UPI001237D96B|nr:MULTISPECIES: thiamine phosphate synthase [unclassified Campylobacter]KAA6225616.1 thiamine phosphate synthase [Campylobacter sp. LR185c]KAA6227532.1 thiamine phosphate synthase [Campylobacter sp. LR196d]KAA6228559.1 thiamine phosphate synthase [Campylobacter sp. LR286c]KAA6230949.1 thiamine phosphate synthase [Campylobacter sp. LR291e]KAA6233583.1 thiamine phosphate synthase [Campylobacter sp. LR264d]
MKKLDLSLYLVASKKENQSDECFLSILENAIYGGVSIIQLREKNLSTRDFFKLGLKVKKLCNVRKIPFIINDRLDLALALNSDGLHLGQDDLDIKIARKFLGSKKIIGLSVKNLKQLKKSVGADYLGCGTIRQTPTKQSLVLSKDDLKDIIKHSKVPVVAIGGIDEEVIKDLKGLNLAGIAVVRAILDSNDSKRAALNLKKVFNTYIKGI